MLYLFKRGYMPQISVSENERDEKVAFQNIKKIRKVQTSRDLCYGNTIDLYRFKKEVFGYRFQDEPDYDKLRGMLHELSD